MKIYPFCMGETKGGASPGLINTCGQLEKQPAAVQDQQRRVYEV